MTKWTSTWRERFARAPLEVVEIAEASQREALDAGEVDLCFVRLPIEVDGLHVIPLYEEVPVVWVSKEHPIAAVDEVRLADLADEMVLTRADATAIDQVALDVAVLLVPMSIARGHSRRDLTYRPVADAPSTRIGLAWLADRSHPMTDEFIGVVRGRTQNSSRTQQERGTQRERVAKPKPKSQTDPGRGRRSRRHR